MNKVIYIFDYYYYYYYHYYYYYYYYYQYYYLAGKGLHKKVGSTSLTVHVNSVELEQVQFHKLLGVIINTQLNFKKDIDNICKKVTQRIAVLEKVRRHFTFRSTNFLLQCHDKKNGDE